MKAAEKALKLLLSVTNVVEPGESATEVAWLELEWGWGARGRLVGRAQGRGALARGPSAPRFKPGAGSPLG